MSALSFVLYRLMVVTALATAANVTQGSCRDGWTYVEKTNACYKAVFDAETWDGALQACSKWNASLPIIHDVVADKALLDFALKYVTEENFHIALRRNAHSDKWEWTDGSKVDYIRSEDPLGVAGPACVWATLGVRSPTSVWQPVECNKWERSYICVADASSPVPSTGGATPRGPLRNSTAPSHTDGPTSGGSGVTVDVKIGKKCEDAVAAWKCKTLKTVYACKASKYIAYPEKNCAKTCGLCH
ncbi:FRAS1-related extracellular matrix protein 1 [Aphelenchoides avenae]|nr:FRAS1-related extracellular matrix protein 1 [Aphelenchus avenae]